MRNLRAMLLFHKNLLINRELASVFVLVKELVLIGKNGLMTFNSMFDELKEEIILKVH